VLALRAKHGLTGLGESQKALALSKKNLHTKLIFEFLNGLAHPRL